MNIMNIMRSPEIRTTVFCQLSAAMVGFVGCLFLSVPAAFVLLSVAAVITFIQFGLLSKRGKKLSKLCDDIDDILHGAEKADFSEYREGELSILSDEIRKMTVRLREQNSALYKDKQFMKEALEDMSHQLRTPLTAMLLVLGMLRESELTKQQRAEHVRELHRLLSRMQWMLETMLSLSRLEAGAVEFKTEEISVAELINEALEPLSISVELKNITVNTEIEGSPVFRGDRQYFTEAVINVLKNCMEHTPEGGAIRISAAENGIYTGITVTDSGSGIPEQELPRVFERFYRGSEFGKSGYGIGLAFARKIIALQNGSLQVRNAPPLGAEFEIRIYNS
ncbi:MAG: HAMP domain-containing histidine kinase [Oscillospiraceae bacterium]|nr:HAMP domain-containing histidine kinase [Oscillospiraceae bacterium]